MRKTNKRFRHLVSFFFNLKKTLSVETACLFFSSFVVHWWVQFPSSFPHVSTSPAVTRFFFINRKSFQKMLVSPERITNHQFKDKCHSANKRLACTWAQDWVREFPTFLRWFLCLGMVCSCIMHVCISGKVNIWRLIWYDIDMILFLA